MGMTHLRVGPLVRATNATSVVIWAELPYPCTILLNAQNVSATDVTQQHTTSIRSHTVTIGGRHYIAPQLQGLQPTTWYTYWLSLVIQTEQEEHTELIDASLVSCFRTMSTGDENNTPEHHSSSATPQQFRIAYGSCRKFVAPQVDALSAFGRWLREHDEQKETMWPHLLLLIGDQIYADQPSQEVKQQYPQLQGGAKTFEDFALLYEYVWTQDTDVRQVLACIPTYMIFDDHEITNNWNITPQWCAMMLQTGQEQVLVDGLIAYWLYQGWGNLAQRDETLYPLLRLMQQGEQSGEDILETLRSHIRREVGGEHIGRWHYEIQTVPPIFVLNARSERTSVFTEQQDDLYGPTRILSQTQMQEVATWLQKHDTRSSLLVSSVPVLLPPLIGLAEYIMGLRLWAQPVRWLGRRIAHIQQRVALRTGFDHWPLFSDTWHELVQILTKRTHDIIVLSGDVHFSYAMEAQRSYSKAKARLLQLVSTPLQNALEPQSERLVTGQTRITRTNYGGMDTRMLQLRTPDGKKRIQYDMLFQNTLACVTLTPDDANVYKVQQEYLVVVDGRLQTAGYTVMTER
ncbi:MAG: alkaline phosphatase D family protein [Ktedonobacteraceae bacterium]